MDKYVFLSVCGQENGCCSASTLMRRYSAFEQVFIIASLFSIIFLLEGKQAMHTHAEERSAAVGTQPLITSGIVLHSPILYDLTVRVALLGRERAFRDKLVQLARISHGESVLDVGCGTGTLAIAAKRRVGTSGSVYGVDASPEMLWRAEKKARKAGAEVVFRTGLAESLPFPDAQFDVVLSTVMLHHLPLKARQQCAKEIRRVLKPSGRVLAVDFEGFSDQKRSLLSHFRRPHGHVSARDLIALLSEAGLTVIESGAVGIRDLQFILATWLPLLPLKKAEG
jgi:SAM-dependent methyltransferase